METQETVIDTPNVAILMVGLDEAGKTSLLYSLKQGGVGDLKTIPTIGYNEESIEFEGKNYTFWDIGGRDTVRVLWKFYAENKFAVLFVVDASNSARFKEAADFLHTIMAYKGLNKAMLLIVSNKHDKAHCSTDEELKEKLKLKSIRQSIRIVSTSIHDHPSLKNILVQLKDVNIS